MLHVLYNLEHEIAKKSPESPPCLALPPFSQAFKIRLGFSCCSLSAAASSSHCPLYPGPKCHRWLGPKSHWSYPPSADQVTLYLHFPSDRLLPHVPWCPVFRQFDPSSSGLWASPRALHQAAATPGWWPQWLVGLLQLLPLANTLRPQLHADRCSCPHSGHALLMFQK